MAYIGKAPPTTGKDAGASFDIDDVSSNFNGSTTAFAIEVGGESLTPTSTNVFIFLGGVLQHPGDAYTISGSNIAFTAAPESGTSFQGTVLGHTRTITPDQGTVGDTSFASSAGTAISGSFTAVSSSLASRITSEESDFTAAGISGSITTTSSSIATRFDSRETDMTLATASIAAITASLGQPVNTDSNVQFADITSTGTITAVEVHTTFVSSSIAVASGSNQFGDATDDHHSFTGSLSVSSSLSVTGSVGIGTAAPVSTMHLYDFSSAADASVGLTIEQAGTGDAILQFLETGTQRWVVGLDNSDSDKFKISSDGDLNSNARLTIDTSGNVGIGTTAPDEMLHLKSSTSAKPVLKIENTNDDTTGPTLEFCKNPATDDTDNDVVGQVDFIRQNDEGNERTWGQIRTYNTDAGAEYGQVRIGAKKGAGSPTDILFIGVT